MVINRNFVFLKQFDYSRSGTLHLGSLGDSCSGRATRIWKVFGAVSLRGRSPGILGFLVDFIFAFIDPRRLSLENVRS